MNKLSLFLYVVLWTASSFALADPSYMDKYQAYSAWSENLPENPSPEFLTFIRSDTPLSNKLREKWLSDLAAKKDWLTFTLNYKASENTRLKCYAQLAKYHQGQQEEALNAAKSLWLAGKSQPEACDPLFALLTGQEHFDEGLITQRIVLALGQRNLQLARYLLKQYKQPRIKDTALLFSIYKNPANIKELQTGELHDDFYLYGLKRMVSKNMDHAIKYWQHAKTKKLLSVEQQQAFLAHVALYKAMRGHEDTYQWFRKIKPGYYNDALLDWQIRFALKKHQWQRVQHLIASAADNENPCWQYWLARSLEAQGKKDKADVIYQKLSKTRHYYGFLASLRLNKSFQFANEKPISDMKFLENYQPFLLQVKSLYESNQAHQASRKINDFMSELPKDEASALAYWVGNELQWHGKSVYISNSNDDLNNQLALRFPVSHRQAVKNYSKTYTIKPELIYAIIRQESAFRGDVVSSAGARGLMQIMPSTAKMVARKEKIPYSDQRQLFILDKNINIGVAYLQQLSKRFNQHPVLMAAAYNAGPRQVNYWLKNHPPKAIDIWIETLPWHETRNYLKNVMAFYAVYQYQLHKKSDLKAFMKQI